MLQQEVCLPPQKSHMADEGRRVRGDRTVISLPAPQEQDEARVVSEWLGMQLKGRQGPRGWQAVGPWNGKGGAPKRPRSSSPSRQVGHQ